MGQVLAQFYLGPYHHSTAAELAAWLAKYKNQPESRAIYHLLLERLPPALPGLRRPIYPMCRSLGLPLPEPHRRRHLVRPYQICSRIRSVA